MDASKDDGSGSSSDDGRGQSEGSADELLAAVIGARYLFLMRRHRRNAAQRARRRRVVGSVAGRRADRPRDFDQGMRGIMRDYFGVDEQPPVYGEETFERRFRVPRSVFMRLFEAIWDRPFWRRASMRRGGHKLILYRSWWPPSVSSRTGSRMIVRMSMSGYQILQLRWPRRS